MKYLSAVLLTAVAATAGCSSVSNTNTNNANLRGQNTNTGYVQNTNTTAKPTIPADATNLQPGNLPLPATNTNTNANTRRDAPNSNVKPMNSNTKATPKP